MVELFPRDPAAIAGNGKGGPCGITRLPHLADPEHLVVRKTQELNDLAVQEINPLVRHIPKARLNRFLDQRLLAACELQTPKSCGRLGEV